MSEQFTGYVIIKDGNNKQRILLHGDDGVIAVKNSAGKELFHFSSTYAALYLGGQGNEGDLIVKDGKNKERIKLDGGEGDIWVKNAAGKTLFHFDSAYAALYLGGQGNEGDLIVRDENNKERIKLDGHTGDIKLFGADCAENFVVADAEQIEPGTVMVIDNEEKLRPSENPYDTMVAGIISGAENLRPGIVLSCEPTNSIRVPIALNGKVYCKIDARETAVRVGDLLTTSSARGHAMKATDHSRAFGAVLGKALRSLPSGKGMIPVLVSLQ